jgi:hypothetical protein
LNQTDYKTFRAMLVRILPNVATWLNTLGASQRDDGSGLPTINTEWANILGDCTTDECGIILRRLAAQELPFPQWQELPGFIRRETLNRRPKPKSEYLVDVGQKFVVTGDISQAFKEMRQCNGDADQVEAVKQKWLAKWDAEKHNEPRYRCPDCLDVGMVICWHIHCLKEYAATGTIKRPIHAAVKCSCNASAKWGDGKDCKERPPQYRKMGFCKWINGALHEVSDWFEWRRTQGIEHHANYNSDLVIVGGEFEN